MIDNQVTYLVWMCACSRKEKMCKQFKFYFEFAPTNLGQRFLITVVGTWWLERVTYAIYSCHINEIAIAINVFLFCGLMLLFIVNIFGEMLMNWDKFWRPETLEITFAATIVLTSGFAVDAWQSGHAIFGLAYYVASLVFLAVATVGAVYRWRNDVKEEDESV